MHLRIKHRHRNLIHPERTYTFSKVMPSYDLFISVENEETIYRGTLYSLICRYRYFCLYIGDYLIRVLDTFDKSV